MAQKIAQFQWSVIGHEQQKQFIANAIKTGRLAHGYLFCGLANSGKTTFATDLARILLCQAEENLAKPCGQCLQCRTQSSVNTQYLLFDDHQPLRIEDIRRLQQLSAIKGWLGGWKVAILARAERLTDEAAAALLKFLEEPVSNVVIILTTAIPNALPQTVRSRLQPLRFGRASPEELKFFCELKGISAELAQAAGSVSGRIGLLKDLASNPERYEQWKQWAAQLRALPATPVYERLKQSGELADGESEAISRVLEVWLGLLAAELTEASQSERVFALKRLLATLLQTIQDIDASMNKRISLDTFMMAF